MDILEQMQRLKKTDPLQKAAEKQSEQAEYSPMDPPEAYSPPMLETLSLEDYHPFLREMVEEHKVFIKKLDEFETVLEAIRSEGINREADKIIREFFHFLDFEVMEHNRKEEKKLFPRLKERLLEEGEHSQSETETPQTVVDVLEDDHLKVLQQAAIVFNFFGLSIRLPDASSRVVVLDAALEQGKLLVELLRLHIFREDNVVFPQAQKLIDVKELDAMR